MPLNYYLMNKFILIQTTSEDDSTNDVCDWLLYNNQSIVRINNHAEVSKVSFKSENRKFILKGENFEVDYFNIKSVWYRRGKYTLPDLQIFDINGFANLSHFIERQCLKDFSFVLDLLKTKNILINNYVNNYNDNFINKIAILNMAFIYDIKVPAYLVSNEISEINMFMLKYPHTFIKDVEFNSIHGKINDLYKYHIYLKKLNNLAELKTGDNDLISPVFFQQYIPKKYEIRSFYLKGQFRSMVIFSQQNEKTKLDFRNYDHEGLIEMCPTNYLKL